MPNRFKVHLARVEVNQEGFAGAERGSLLMLLRPCNAGIELICRHHLPTFIDVFDEYLRISKVTWAEVVVDV